MEVQLKKMLIFITNDIKVADLNLREIKFNICRYRFLLDHFISAILTFVDCSDSTTNVLEYHKSLLMSDDKRIKPILEHESYMSNIKVLIETKEEFEYVIDPSNNQENKSMT